MSRKILFIISAIFIIVVVIATIWFFFFLNQTTENPNDRDGGSSQTFFPVTTTFTPDTTEPSSNTTATEPTIPTLRQISRTPTAGGIAFEREVFLNEPTFESTTTPETTMETVFRYIERATGHLYETTERSLSQTRLSNVTIPKIQEAFFDASGGKMLLRYLGNNDEILETFAGELITTGTSTEEMNEATSHIEGDYLETGITEIAVGANLIAYIREVVGGSTTHLAQFDGSAPRLIHVSPLKNFLIEMPNPALVTLTTKADSRLNGDMFFVNPTNGLTTSIIEDVAGLTTTTNSDVSKVVLSESTAQGFRSYVFDVATKSFRVMPVSVLPEKCAWSTVETNIIYCAGSERTPQGGYPQAWYQGLVSFNDTIFRIDVNTNSSDPLVVLQKESGKEFDATKLIVSPNDEYLLFINKNDLTLWSYDLRS